VTATARPVDPRRRDLPERLDRLRTRARGHGALGEVVWRDLADPAEESFAAAAGDPARPDGYVRVVRVDAGEGDWAVGLVLDPAAGDAATAALLDAALDHVARHGGGRAVLWVFGPDADDDRRARMAGFEPHRDVLQMRVPLPLDVRAGIPPGVRLRTFRPGADEDAFVALNNRAFAGHPEQGGWTRATLARRMAEPWFDPELLLIAEDAEGPVGFDWLKIHPAAGDDPVLGEIYAIGVDPRGRGQGLGRALAVAGLERVAALGVPVGMLYVDADNAPALALYRSIGFRTHRVDRAYERRVDPR